MRAESKRRGGRDAPHPLGPPRPPLSYFRTQQRPIPNLCTSRMSRNQHEGYDMKDLTDTDPRVMLTEITEAQANAAVATIARRATSRADLAELLAMVAPMPYTPPTSAPSQRRAAPRRGVEA